MLHCGLQQCFGVRAGDKNGGRNLKSNGPEIAGADDIGNGSPVHATPHELRELRWEHDVAKLEQQLLPHNTDSMRKHQFSIKAWCSTLVPKPAGGGAERPSRRRCHVASQIVE